MQSGLLWYDGDRRKSLGDKITEGIWCYEAKFGHRPNACHLNPGAEGTYPQLRLVANRLIQPNHFWLGVEVEQESSAEPAGSTRT
ncbi:MAG: hypothetical protein M1401_04590 [Chloroflexi bacterium]|nr:hypothetical protein [Chloroflexota bacterium]MCL5108130.1 hypothetical protein [Chloroflexota bacterium]